MRAVHFQRGRLPSERDTRPGGRIGSPAGTPEQPKGGGVGKPPPQPSVSSLGPKSPAGLGRPDPRLRPQADHTSQPCIPQGALRLSRPHPAGPAPTDAGADGRTPASLLRPHLCGGGAGGCSGDPGSEPASPWQLGGWTGPETPEGRKESAREWAPWAPCGPRAGGVRGGVGEHRAVPTVGSRWRQALARLRVCAREVSRVRVPARRGLCCVSAHVGTSVWGAVPACS